MAKSPRKKAAGALRPALPARTPSRSSGARPARSPASRAPRRGSEGAFAAATAQDTAALLAALHRLYPEADCELHWQTPLDLLVATILSAQSTDQRVNTVTAHLFTRYRSAADYARAGPAEFEREIHSTGFFRQKTKHVLGAARRLVAEFGGEVPATMEELLTLPGVARKTANVVLGTAFRKPLGVVVDTHVKRLAFRLGLSAAALPGAIEQDLMVRLPRGEWIFAAQALIWHGRRVCAALRPACGACALRERCPRNGLPL